MVITSWEETRSLANSINCLSTVLVCYVANNAWGIHNVCAWTHMHMQTDSPEVITQKLTSHSLGVLSYSAAVRMPWITNVSPFGVWKSSNRLFLQLIIKKWLLTTSIRTQQPGSGTEKKPCNSYLLTEQRIFLLASVQRCFLITWLHINADKIHLLSEAGLVLSSGRLRQLPQVVWLFDVLHSIMVS